MSHAQWTHFEGSKGGSKRGSPHNLVSEKHVVMKGSVHSTMLGGPSLRLPNT